MTHHRHHSLRDIGTALGVFFLAITLILLPFRFARSAGIDDVTVTLTDSEATATETRISVVFTPTTALLVGNTISMYLGPTTAGEEFTDGDTDQTGADVGCVQSGTTFNTGTFAAASATSPMLYRMTVATVGAGTAAVTCTLGTSGTDAPSNPGTPDGYSVAVVTTSDSGAGIAYVGNGNDVTVTASVLPNITLTIDNADGTVCTTASSVTSCALGVVTTAAVNTGNYDVNVGSNATNGVTLQAKDDGNLRNGADDIDDITENTTVAAGTEGNGVAVAVDAGWTEVSPFDDDDTPTTTSNQTVAITAAPVATTNDVTITHRVAVSAATKALTYTHIMTYTATANF